MRSNLFVAAVMGLALVAGTGVAENAAKVKSGPQVGEEVPGPFHPLNVNGEYAGKKQCLYCINGSNPVAMVFARDCGDKNLHTLIKKIDEATAKNAGKKMGSFVVFLSDEPDLEKKLKGAADELSLKHTVLSIDNPAGPKKYNVAQNADVTVVLYTDHNVKANYAFEHGKLTAKAVDKIVADISKILPQ